jgi:hypothetical protein
MRNFFAVLDYHLRPTAGPSLLERHEAGADTASITYAVASKSRRRRVFFK